MAVFVSPHYYFPHDHNWKFEGALPETNDLVLQLRKQGIDKIILAGMSANLCTESHMRELMEQGFEVAVVSDATAAAQVAEGDGYHAALVNFRFIANTVWTTEQAVKEISSYSSADCRRISVNLSVPDTDLSICQPGLRPGPSRPVARISCERNAAARLRVKPVSYSMGLRFLYRRTIPSSGE